MGEVKVYTKALLFLPDNAKKTQLVVTQLKLKKNAPSPRLLPQSDHIISTHTKLVKTLQFQKAKLTP